MALTSLSPRDVNIRSVNTRLATELPASDPDILSPLRRPLKHMHRPRARDLLCAAAESLARRFLVMNTDLTILTASFHRQFRTYSPHRTDH